MSPRRLDELTPRDRKRAILGAVVRFLLVFALIIALYYVLPLDGEHSRADMIIRVAISVPVFVLVVGWQIRRISAADLPQLRAFEALGVAVPLFLAIYAAVYVTLSQLNAGNFNEVLNRTDGLYFTIVTFGTVGFGDIAASSDLARLVVSTQIIGDLGFLAILVRLLTRASRRALGKPPDEPPTYAGPGNVPPAT